MMHKGSLGTVLALLVGVAAHAQTLLAQMPMAAGEPQAQGAMQALFITGQGGLMGGGSNPYVDAHGNPVVVPAGFNAATSGGGGLGHHGHGQCADGSCGPYGDDCCDPCNPYGMMGEGQGRYGIVERVFDRIAYACLGGDQRGPHYFDVRAEAVYLERDETFGPNIDFTSRNIADPVAGPFVVLSSSDLQYDEETGFRIVGRYDICPLSVFEYSYMGIYSFEDSAAVEIENPNDPLSDRFFSLFSDFGLNPVMPEDDMPQTERAIFHQISIESQLQTAELTYRRYWVGFLPRISGTLLAGFRYTRLNEEFEFNTVGETLQTFSYTTETDNHLAGFQAGGDIWISLLQGMRIGAEGKAGIYNNRLSVDTNIATSPPATPPELSESDDENKVAFLGEASADIVIDILPSSSLRAGYEVLWINSLALAGDNFNTSSPFDVGAGLPRVPFLDDDGEVFYHGAHAGIEYVW